MLSPLLRRSLRAACAALCFAAPAWSQLSFDSSVIPSGSNNSSTTENVDFGDVDLDGDWDIVMADGGDDGNDQNRIWINQGGVQLGTVGTFTDETVTRFPAIDDDSRDIEFVDFDNDADLDLYISNTAQISNQGNRWWTNQGGDQMGSIGFYVDETAARWVNLGGTGSSIDPTEIIAGTFIDWSCDCDFGDLDNDGDMDLVHSSYGGSFDGDVPTRIFLNDGAGNFEELNPSGHQLVGPEIQDGDPGLWCEGEQDSDTTDATGQFCDIAATALDIDIGDIDNDFDLDILHGSRNEAPRMFVNRLDGSSLAPASAGLLFRDVTGMVFPAGYFAGTFGHYEQEMGDFDGDGNLDIYGLNWRFAGFNFTDVVMRNQGDGTFGNLFELPGSGADDNEGDFVDIDNDGDLDLYVANFTGQDKLYLNNGSGGYTLGSVPGFSAVSLDADCADVDNDGDYDVLIAEDNFAANTFLRNITQVPDTTPPYIPNVEDVAARLSLPGTFPVRAHVYDNAPYYITWYNETWVELTINGCPVDDIPAMSSGGQVFRAVLPGNVLGNVRYRFVSEDQYGNRGRSSWVSFLSQKFEKRPGPPGSAPSVQAQTFGPGTRGPAGVPGLEPLTTAYAGSPYYLGLRYDRPGAEFAVVLTDAPRDASETVPGALAINVGGNLLATFRGEINEDGVASVSLGHLPADLARGTKAYAQLFVLTEGGWAASQGLTITSN